MPLPFFLILACLFCIHGCAMEEQYRHAKNELFLRCAATELKNSQIC